jgi:ribosomal protein S18 acetylase RimI-like enzyme
MPDPKITYLLEMSDRAQLRPRRVDMPELEVKQVEIACPELNWFLHQAVGAAFCWGGREDWDEQRWTEYVDRPQFETWVACVSGTPAGYFELELQEDGSVRIECFGLLPSFFGKGLGGHLLTVAVERGWEKGAARVWLTTCSHDHDHALKNYLSRGFQLVAESTGPANKPRPSMLFRSE